jgi:LacI family transcriptional regulator
MPAARALLHWDRSLISAGRKRSDSGRTDSRCRRERVRRAAEQLGFTPDGLGRGLSWGRSYTVGLVTTDSFGRFSMSILLGAEDALGAGEMAVLLCDTRDDTVREQHHLRNLVARRVDGIILTGRRTEPRPPISVPAPIPVVHVFTPLADSTATSVIADDPAGARLAVEHLLDLGRQRIAHITGPQSHRAATFRADAAVSAIRAGGAVVAEPIRYGEWSERWGRHAIAALLRREPHLDAVTCGSD